MREFSGISLRVQGHLRILEYADAESYARRDPSRTLLNRRNAIHKDHAAILVANALVHRSNYNITYMVFGNGGTTLDDTGTVSFKAPNDTGTSPDLYNTTFFQMVDDRRGSLPGNQMGVRHIGGSLFADMDIRCLIDQNQPFGQLSTNTLGSITEATTWGAFHSKFSFDEIGLKTADGTLITHVVFTPVVKTASSLLEVIYTIRVAIPAAPGVVLPTDIGAFLIGVQATAQVGTIDIVPPVFLVGAEVTTEVGTTEIDGSGLPSLLVDSFAGIEAIAETGVPTISIPGLLDCGHPPGDHIIRSNLSQTVQGGSAGGPELAQTCGVAAGQFYFEVNMDSGATIDACAVGIAIATADENDVNALWVGGVGYNTQGRIDLDGVTQSLLNGNIAPGGVLGVAVDTINHRIYFYANRSPDDAAHIPASLPSFQPAIGNFGAVNFSSFGTDDFCLTILFKTGTADQFTVVNSSFTYPPPIGYGFGWGGAIPDEATYLALDPVASANVTFGVNDYACIGSGSIASGTRSITSHTTGKRYFEFMKEGMVWNGSWAAIIDSTQSVTGGLSGTHGKGLVGAGGGLGNLIDNAIGQVAVDVGAQLLWIRPTGSGNWNNNALADPATGVGGASLATLTGPIYFGMGTAAPGGFGAAERMLFISNPNYFKYSVPAGFTPGF